MRKKGKFGVNSICESTSGANSDNDEYAFTVDSGNIGGMVTVQLGGVSVEVLIDSGASTNVIDKRTWEELKSQKCDRKLYAYGCCEPLKVIGCFETTVVLCKSACEAEFVVIEGKGQPLLG